MGRCRERERRVGRDYKIEEKTGRDRDRSK